MKKILLLFLIIPFLFGATYTVGTGKDFSTISQVNSATFQPDDIIVFDDDATWNETLVIPSSGTSGHHITLKRSGTGTNKPLIQGDTATAWSMLASIKQYLTFEGLHFKNSRDNDTAYAAYVSGGTTDNQEVWFNNCDFENTIDKNVHTLYIKNTNNFRVTNSTISGGNYGINIQKGVPSWDGQPTMSGLIDNCTIHDQDDGLADEWDGIKLAGNHFTLTISNNNFYGWNEDAIDSLGGGGNVTIENNTFHDPGTALINYCTGVKLPMDSLTGIRISQAKFIIRGNKFYNLRPDTTGGWGVYSNDPSGEYHSFPHEIYNNIFYNCDRPINIGSFGPILIYHNTCTGKARGIAIQNNTVAIVQNNIFKSDVGGYDFATNGNNCNVTGGYNLLAREASVTGTGYTGNTTDIYASDPLLSPTYHLKSGSPAIGAGVDVGVDTDFYGNPRLGTPDIGAVEYGTFVRNATIYNATFN